jgi:hypothetical protein
METDAELIEKTLQTFHPAHIALAPIYCMQVFSWYESLLSALLLAEKNLW